MLKIAIIVPKDLVQIAKKAANESNEDITILEGSMDKGLFLAKELEKSGYDAIIVRGGTQLLLKTEIMTPIISIPIKTIDIYKTIKEAEGIDNKMAILAFENMISAIESYEEIIGIKYEKYIVRNEIEVAEKIKMLCNKGVKVIIGGGIINRFKSKYEITPIVIKTGIEAFINAIEESKRLAIATRKEKEKAERFKAIVEHSRNGVISTDDKGTIISCNSVAEKMLKIKSEDTLHKDIDEIIPNINFDEIIDNECDEVENIKDIGNNKYIISKIPITVKKDLVGAVIILQDTDKIQQMEQMIRREIVSTGHFARYTFDDMIGCGEEIKEIIRIGKEYAKVDSTVLIEGETGTGKEIMAQSIHNYSDRKNCPFVALNCAALPESLLESELFGYAQGAFTGADKKGKKGLFELAHGGTIFLDEISEMNPLLQGRLLRVLQEKQVMRIGDNKIIPIDVRVIAASNKNLASQIEEHSFREDLFYRLNVLRLSLLPLRERKEDIICFLDSFIYKYSNKLKRENIILSSDAIEYLSSYEWPGNVRELKNFVERLVVMAKKRIMSLEDIKYIFNYSENENNKRGKISVDIVNLEDGESIAITNALKNTKGNITMASKLLGISRTTLWRKMKKYNMHVAN